MSAALTHVAVGLLLGLALGVRLRHLPLAALLALLPDLDHLDLFLAAARPFVQTRVTFHNVAFCVALPLAALAVAWRRTQDEHLRRLAVAAPLLLSSHLLLDMLPVDVGGAKVALWYPFSRAWVTAEARTAYAVDPTAYSTLTLVILILVALAIGTLLAARRLDRPARVAAFAGAWLLVFPALALGGLVLPAPAHPVATLTMEDPALHLPQSRFTAVVAHLGGNVAGAKSLRMELWADGAKVGEATNPSLLAAGDRWAADFAVPAAVADAAKLQARLVAAANGAPYATHAARVLQTHVPTRIEATLDAGAGVLRLANAGAQALPAGAIRATLSDADGTLLAEAVNPHPIAGGDAWEIGVRVPVAATTPLALLVVATTDEHAYLNAQLDPAAPPRTIL